MYLCDEREDPSIISLRCCTHYADRLTGSFKMSCCASSGWMVVVELAMVVTFWKLRIFSSDARTENVTLTGIGKASDFDLHQEINDHRSL